MEGQSRRPGRASAGPQSARPSKRPASSTTRRPAACLVDPPDCSPRARSDVPVYPVTARQRLRRRLPGIGMNRHPRHFPVALQGRNVTKQRTLNPLAGKSSLTAWPPTVPYLLIANSLASGAATFAQMHQSGSRPEACAGKICTLRSAANFKPPTAARRPCPWPVRARGLCPWPSVENQRLHRPSENADAVRYTSVDSATQGSTAAPGDTWQDRDETTRIAAYLQAIGPFPLVWQVVDSNHRRRSRRFYSLASVGAGLVSDAAPGRARTAWAVAVGRPSAGAVGLPYCLASGC
jgi:hypothetical protein